uniref:Putative secreted protein n=1 Tax=Anopheles darlingi TaxID=43151 RepID=A0A2M4DA66_ANODA
MEPFGNILSKTLPYFILFLSILNWRSVFCLRKMMMPTNSRQQLRRRRFGVIPKLLKRFCERILLKLKHILKH